MERRLKRLPDQLYFSAILPILSLLPKRISYDCARFLGRRLFRYEEATRNLMLEHLCQVFTRSGATQMDREEVVLTFFQHLTCEDLDAYYYLRWSKEKLDRVFSFDGLHHLDEVLKRGRGALLATGHFGAPCAALVGLGIKGYPITHVSREYQSDPSIPSAFRAYSLDKLRRIERRIGSPLINAIGSDDLPSYQAVFQILKQLRRNQLVSMAIDVSPNLVEDGMGTRFLGRPSRFTSNLVRLATQSQTPIIPYFIQRDGRDWSRFRISLRPPILMSGDIQADLQVCVDHLEEVILKCPEQWFIWDSLSHFWQGNSG